MKLSIIHQDDQIVVVEKPAHLLTIPDRHDADLPSLVHLLSRRTKQTILPVHRLDKPTSGLLVFAKTKTAQRQLSQQFEQRLVQKIYLALVEGRPREPQGDIKAALAPHPTKPGRMMVSVKGKAAHSKYEVVDFFGDYSLLQVDLLTGRTHQIRVHLQSIGHPLLVDPFYGSRSELKLSSLKRNYQLKKGTEERPLLSRVPLHAHKLHFQHPENGNELTFTSELPKDMRATIQQLKKLL